MLKDEISKQVEVKAWHLQGRSFRMNGTETTMHYHTATAIATAAATTVMTKTGCS